MTTLYAIELLVAAAALSLFLINYLRGNWRTEVGGHLAAFTFVITLLVMMRLLDVVIGPLSEWFWVAGWALLDVVCWWRLWLLWRIRTEEEEEVGKP